MLIRQKLWKPLLSVNPAFGAFWDKYGGHDPVSTGCLQKLGVDAHHMYVAMDKDRHGREVAAMLAVAAQVHGDVCDEVVGDSEHRRRMSVGYASALADTLNTYHIMGRLLPSTTAHVTVNMQSEMCGSTDLTEGTDIIVISTIRKLGKQLCYCTTDILHEPKEVPPHLLAQEAEVKTYVDLQRALRNYETLFHNAHVKAFMNMNLDQGGGAPAKPSRG